MEEEKKNDASGKAFFERITEVLEDLDIPRTTFISDLNLSQAIVTNWKQLKGLPAAETVLKIAKYLHVSPEWLANGRMEQDSPYMDMEPSVIADRIYHGLSEFNFKRLNEITPWRMIMTNCSKNRYKLSIGEVIYLSENFYIPIDYLLNKKGFDQFEIRDKTKWSSVENTFNSLPIEHQNALEVQFRAFSKLKDYADRKRRLCYQNQILGNRLENKKDERGRIDWSKKIKAYHTSENSDKKSFDPVAFLDNYEPPEDSEE